MLKRFVQFLTGVGAAGFFVAAFAYRPGAPAFFLFGAIFALLFGVACRRETT